MESVQNTQLLAALQAEQMSRETGPITLEGTITDEEGNPLNEVPLRVSRSLASSIPFQESKSEEADYEVNSTFRIELDTCFSARLTFRKNGYSERKMVLIHKMGSKGFGEPLGSVRYEGKTKVHDGLHIVLRSTANSTRLHSFGTYLKLYPNGDRRVYDLQHPLKPGGPEVNHGYGAKLVKSGDPVASGTMFLETVPARNKPKPLFREGCYDWPPNQDILVVLDDLQDGGLIRVKSMSDERFPDKKPFWFMRMAPKQGYKKRMRITQVDLGRFRNGEEVYFYCRSNGKFGKGRLCGGYSYHLGYSFEVRISYQPSGSRNLETKD